MTQDEYDKLVTKYGKTIVDSKIDSLDANIQSKIKKYMQFKDHYATIGNWCRMDKVKEQPRAAPITDPVSIKL